MQPGMILCDAAGHGHVDGACGVVPTKSETELTGAGSFGGDGVDELEDRGEIVSVFAAGVSDFEIIDNQTEEDRTGSMVEETGRMLCVRSRLWIGAGRGDR
jgi:hypothetical protein